MRGAGMTGTSTGVRNRIKNMRFKPKIPKIRKERAEPPEWLLNFGKFLKKYCCCCCSKNDNN